MNFGGNRILLYILIVSFLQMSDLYSQQEQKIEWAYRVIGFSSQHSKVQFSANQILGKPNILPTFGESPCSWTPDLKSKSTEWIRVQFNEPLYTEQIAIIENENPGAITRVTIYDSLNRGYEVYANNLPGIISEKGRIFQINIERTDFRVFQLKVELTLHNDLVYQINSIAISDSQEPIVIKINQAEEEFQYEPENLESAINSPYPELAPVISADGKTLYFTRDKHPDNIGPQHLQDIWYSTLDSNNNFTNAIQLPEPINNEFSNFLISVSPDGNTIYLGNKYNEDGTMSRGISVSNFDGTKWSFPKSLSIYDYYNLSRTGSYSIAANSRIMILSLERRDSYGGMDLYVSFFINDKGIWSEPQSLGPSINTADNEVTPFLAPDNETLYFSSGGFPGYGLNDMFISRRLDDTWQNWSEPQNLGPSINTPGWDAYYTVTATGDYAYFVSSENTLGENDIFRIRLQEDVRPRQVVIISGKVLDSKTNKPVEAEITYEILPKGEQAGIARSNLVTGYYQIILPMGHKYAFSATAAGYIAINEYLDLTKEFDGNNLEVNLMLVPIEVGQTIRLNNIFFEYNEYELLDISYPELRRIAQILKGEPKLKILISGHTDNIGSAFFNQQLSLKRAQAVADYLVGLGVNTNRLKIGGFGFSKPVAENDTEEGRRLNRRVEFEILEN